MQTARFKSGMRKESGCDTPTCGEADSDCTPVIRRPARTGLPNGRSGHC
jgi:hypothetical protein